MRWSRRIGLAAAFLLGVVLLVAAWTKMLDPMGFAEQIGRQGLDLVLSPGAMAILAIGVEIFFGVALVLGLRGRWILWGTGALILFFLVLTGRTYWLWSNGLLSEEAAAGCGCFGNLVLRTPAEAFWQDLALLVPLYLASWLGRREAERAGGVRRALVPLATIAGMLLAWRAPALPLDDLATRLKPGVRIEEICAGGESEAESICLDVLLPQLAEGSHWVILSELDDETFRAGIEQLNDMTLADPETGVWVLNADEPVAHQAFFWEVGPAFEVREVPLPLIRPLYRTTPRSFRLQDGMVSETVSGLPERTR